MSTQQQQLEEPLIAARDPTEITTFREFYPYYLTEHRKPLTKFLHCCGTCCSLPFLLSACYYLVSGLAIFLYLATIGASGGLSAFLAPSTVENDDLSFHLDCFTDMFLRCLLGAALAGYSFAWCAHVFVEKNKPVTLKSARCAAFSLIGDFRMCYETIVLGKHEYRFWKNDV
ncbi:unnamed protein product [Amoebophrya sp. A25]|nr:unnamed protein product [Amoebophrya sp. A25]|eukprot:GSA25T00020762001.1